MRATVNILPNPLAPQRGLRSYKIERKVSIRKLVAKHHVDLTRPTICYHNNVPVLRRDWSSRIVKDGDEVSFVTVPLGGGGSNPLRLVLTIALMYFAGPLAGQLGGMMGIQSQLGMALIKAGIMFVGQQLINALLPTPALPKAQTQAQMAAPSPTYTLSAQGNQARIGQAIPVLYGRLKVFPDFAAQPYAEFEDNEQYLYQLFLVTQGKARINADDVYLEDSPISAFGSTDYDLEILQPGQRSTIFPTAVFNVTELNGQELGATPDASTIGPFPVNPASTTINKIAVDVACSRGLYYANDEGGLDTVSLTVAFYARKIDDVGLPIGAPFQLGNNVVISGATQNAIRKTYKFDVPPGRYTVQFQRVDIKNTGTRYAHELNAMGARGYATQTIDYGNVTMLALKMKATNTFSQQSSRKVNCIAQRLLDVPVFNESSGAYDWIPDQETRSISWAVADMCRAEYGAQVDESRINLNQLTTLNTILSARGDEFNALYDSTQSFWDAVSLALRPGRSRPYIQGAMLNVVRNGLQTIPTAVFTDRNIVKGSFNIDYIMPSDDTSDCVDVFYFDENVWKWRTVRAEEYQGAGTKPALVKFFGVTNRAQAWREGMGMWAENKWQRKRPSFDTELEGHIPSMGALIAIQSSIPNWGQSAEVVSYIGGVFTVTEELKWTADAQHYVMLRRVNGSAHQVLEVLKGAADDQFTLVAGQVLDFEPSTDLSKERTFISFGRMGNVVQLAKVLSMTPKSGTQVSLLTVNEDVRVHSADGGTVPEDLFNYAIPAPKVKPILKDFTVTQTGSGINPSLTVSWPVAVGASRYLVEKSTDGENWEGVAEVTMTSHSFLGSIGVLYIRVAAVGGVVGPYITKTINVGEVAPPPDVTIGSITPSGQSFGVKWTDVVDCDSYRVQVVVAASVKREFTITSNTFDYTLENALADGGPWRTIGVRVWALKGNVQSQTPLVLSGTNQSPAAPSIILVPGNGNISITVNGSTENDYAGTLIFASDTPGFTPSPFNQIYEGTGTFYLLTTPTAKYIKAAHYDTYGKSGLNYSDESSATPLSASGIPTSATIPSTTYIGDVVYSYQDQNLYEWFVDHYIQSAPLIAAQRLVAVSLSVISANMGDLTSGSITLDTAGFIRGGQTDYMVGTGFWQGYKNGTYVMSMGNSAQGFNWNGSIFTIMGKVGGNLELTTAGAIFGGKALYSSTTAGFWMGYDVIDGKFKLKISNGSRGIDFNGDDVVITGDLIATENIKSNAINETLSTSHPGGNFGSSGGPVVLSLSLTVDIPNTRILLNSNANYRNPAQYISPGTRFTLERVINGTATVLGTSAESIAFYVMQSEFSGEYLYPWVNGSVNYIDTPPVGVAVTYRMRVYTADGPAPMSNLMITAVKIKR